MFTVLSCRIGILGASAIAPTAVIAPSMSLLLQHKFNVVGVASRNKEKAARFAANNGNIKVYASYEELLEDPTINAVYISLPNSHHVEWGLKVIAAGKHLLLEKPMAMNAKEAQELENAAKESNLIAFEAYHYRYHPMIKKVKQMITDGLIGNIKSIGVNLCFPVFSGSDIRYNFSLGGGAVMDCGCYCVDVIRYLSGEEFNVLNAFSTLAYPHVDHTTNVVLESTITKINAHFCCSIWKIIPEITLSVTGDNGCSIDTINWLCPQLVYNKISYNKADKTVENFSFDSDNTYTLMCKAFYEAVINRSDFPTTLEEGRKNHELMDAILTCAGLPLRGQV